MIWSTIIVERAKTIRLRECTQVTQTVSDLAPYCSFRLSPKLICDSDRSVLLVVSMFVARLAILICGVVLTARGVTACNPGSGPGPTSIVPSSATTIMTVPVLSCNITINDTMNIPVDFIDCSSGDVGALNLQDCSTGNNTELPLSIGVPTTIMCTTNTHDDAMNHFKWDIVVEDGWQILLSVVNDIDTVITAKDRGEDDSGATYNSSTLTGLFTSSGAFLSYTNDVTMAATWSASANQFQLAANAVRVTESIDALDESRCKNVTGGSWVDRYDGSTANTMGNLSIECSRKFTSYDDMLVSFEYWTPDDDINLSGTFSFICDGTTTLIDLGQTRGDLVLNASCLDEEDATFQVTFTAQGSGTISIRHVVFHELVYSNQTVPTFPPPSTSETSTLQSKRSGTNTEATKSSLSPTEIITMVTNFSGGYNERNASPSDTTAIVVPIVVVFCVLAVVIAGAVWYRRKKFPKTSGLGPGDYPSGSVNPHFDASDSGGHVFTEAPDNPRYSDAPDILKLKGDCHTGSKVQNGRTVQSGETDDGDYNILFEGEERGFYHTYMYSLPDLTPSATTSKDTGGEPNDIRSALKKSSQEGLSNGLSDPASQMTDSQEPFDESELAYDLLQSNQGPTSQPSAPQIDAVQDTAHDYEYADLLPQSGQTGEYETADWPPEAKTNLQDVEDPARAPSTTGHTYDHLQREPAGQPATKPSQGAPSPPASGNDGADYEALRRSRASEQETSYQTLNLTASHPEEGEECPYYHQLNRDQSGSTGNEETGTKSIGGGGSWY